MKAQRHPIMNLKKTLCIIVTLEFWGKAYFGQSEMVWVLVSQVLDDFDWATLP